MTGVSVALLRTSRLRLLGSFVRSEDHHHVPAVEPGFRLDPGGSVELFGEAIEDPPAELRVPELTTPEHDRDLHLVAVVQELLNPASLGLEVTGPDLRAVLHLLDPGVAGLTSRLPGLLRLVELELPVVHDPAYGWVREGGDLDEIEVELAGDFERFGQGLDPQLLTFGIDQAHLSGADSVVDPDLAHGCGGDAALLLFRVLAFQDQRQKRRPHATRQSGGPFTQARLRRPGGGS